MSAVLIIISAFTLVAAVAAMSFRNLVHCVLCGALTFAGLAALFLNLDAQFVGFAQILVYVGAVAILIVFAILLTRGSEPVEQTLVGRSWWGGAIVVVLVWFSLVAAVLLSPAMRPSEPARADVSAEAGVRQIGAELMTNYVLPLEIVALLLTAATIGAVIIAMQEKEVGK